MEIALATVPMAVEADALVVVALQAALAQVLLVVQTLLVQANAMEVVIQNVLDVLPIAKELVNMIVRFLVLLFVQLLLNKKKKE